MATITGSLELIRDDGINAGRTVYRLDPAQVPFVASVFFNVTDVVAVESPRAGVAGEWTATTSDLHAATLLLHQETPLDQTALGRWLAGGQTGSVV